MDLAWDSLIPQNVLNAMAGITVTSRVWIRLDPSVTQATTVGKVSTLQLLVITTPEMAVCLHQKFILNFV